MTDEFQTNEELTLKLSQLEGRVMALESLNTTPCLEKDDEASLEYYMVLGPKLLPVDPNHYDIVNEADNPILLKSYEFAEQVAAKVTEVQRSDSGDFGPMPDFKAEIAAVRILTVCGH